MRLKFMSPCVTVHYVNRFSIDIFHTGAKLDYMDTTTKKPQSLVHIGSEARDALEAIGATMTPPCRWQDLARSVLKNFIGSQVHDAVLQRAQTRLPWSGETTPDAIAVANAALFQGANAK